MLFFLQMLKISNSRVLISLSFSSFMSILAGVELCFGKAFRTLSCLIHRVSLEFFPSANLKCILASFFLFIISKRYFLPNEVFILIRWTNTPICYYWCNQIYFKRLVILSYFSVSAHLAGFGSSYCYSPSR